MLPALFLPFNIIKGSLGTPESSWFYTPSHTILVLQNPESFENTPNHTGIIAESHLNHSLREPTEGVHGALSCLGGCRARMLMRTAASLLNLMIV